MPQTPTPTWQPSPPELVERFGTIMARYPQVERRKMFGYPAAFLGGYMVTGLNGPRWVVRLADADRAELLAAGGATFEPMPGRPMTGYVVLPSEIIADDAVLAGWLDRGLDFVAAMPAKAPRAKR
jgi:TfoX/Sxy family transcriptional regulator of competence genes